MACPNTYNDVYWRPADQREPRRLAGSLRVDVAIIGSGITGLSAAYHIKRLHPTLEAAVLEAGRACQDAALQIPVNARRGWDHRSSNR